MATRQQRRRKKTLDSLMEIIEKNGYNKTFYIDQVDEYMIYYDNLQTLNEKLLSKKNDTKEYMEILKEKRQVTKEMRNILSFLGLTPTTEDGDLSGSDL